MDNWSYNNVLLDQRPGRTWGRMWLSLYFSQREEKMENLSLPIQRIIERMKLIVILQMFGFYVTWKPHSRTKG